MSATTDRERDQAAYRRLKASLDAAYPAGRFLAVVGGGVIADAPSLQELRERLAAAGYDPSSVLVVQAGAEYPETATIFI